MSTHNFTLIASGPLVGDDEIANRLYEAGCDDAAVSFQKGVVAIEFDREARNFIGALFSALVDVRKAGLEVERIEPDYLVSASEIAARSGLGRAAVSLYASGERGKEFPHPIARITSESPLWDWVEVASWMHRQNRVPLQTVVIARVIRGINRAIVREEFIVSDHHFEWLSATLRKSREPERAARPQNLP